MNPDPTYSRHGGNPESNLAFENSREFHGNELSRDRITAWEVEELLFGPAD